MDIDGDFDRVADLAQKTGNSELVDLVNDLMMQTWVVRGERDEQWKAIQMLRDEIARLESLLETKRWIVRWGDAVFASDNHGKPIGEPHCLRCFEADHDLASVVHDPATPDSAFCPSCNTRYSAQSVFLPSGN